MGEHIVSRVQVGPYSRLGWYIDKWSVSDWDEHVWQHIDRRLMERALIAFGRKKHLLRAFVKYLPKKGRIIEAGCGLGQWLILLKRMGYEIQGVEIGEPTVRRAKEFFPEAPLSVADVGCLPFPTGCFQGYVSIGVVEHNEEGPGPALSEAGRILADEGVLLCAVPFFSGLRKLRRRPSGRPEGMDFYQWSFSTGEFIDLLHKTGFEVRETFPYSTLKTLTDEIPLLHRMRDAIRAPSSTKASGPPNRGGSSKSEPNRLHLISRYLVENILEARPVRNWAGHMRMFVAVKRST